jgi:hypothetical protein
VLFSLVAGNRQCVNTDRPIKDVREMQKRIKTPRHFGRNACRWFPSCLATGGTRSQRCEELRNERVALCIIYVSFISTASPTTPTSFQSKVELLPLHHSLHLTHVPPQRRSKELPFRVDGVVLQYRLVLVLIKRTRTRNLSRHRAIEGCKPMAFDPRQDVEEPDAQTASAESPE